MDVKVFTEDGALELAEKLLQNDKNIKDEFEQKGYATEVFVTNAIANAQLSGGDVDLSGYASKDDLDNYAIKEHSHDEYLTEHQDLSDYALKSQIPSLDGYAKTEDIPDEYDDTVLSNRITTVENDYLKSSDKTELTQAIATAKTETIEIILGESVDADFDTLQEVADWIQADTTASAELVIRVTDAESDIVTIQNDYLKSVDKTELLSSISTNATAISKNTTDIAKNATTIEENAEAIADNTTAIAVERARIDALIALEPSEDPTDIEREIEDLKIKVDGTTATTAGDAVREQIGALSSEIEEIESTFYHDNNYDFFGLNSFYVGGTYSATNGTQFNDSKRCRIGRISRSKHQMIQLDDANYEMRLLGHSGTGTSNIEGTYIGKYTEWIGNCKKILVPEDYVYFVIAFRRVDDADMTTVDETAIKSALKSFSSYVDVFNNAIGENAKSIEGVGEKFSALLDTLPNTLKVDWKRLSSETYPLGWRAGYYGESDGSLNTSNYYLRTLVRLSTNNLLTENTKFLLFTPPSGYGARVFRFLLSDSTYLGYVGEYENIDEPILMDISADCYYTFTIGRFDGGDSAQHITEEFTQSIDLRLFTSDSGTGSFKSKESDLTFFTVDVNSNVAKQNGNTTDNADNQNNMVATNCVLALPNSYKPTGTPTPLIMYCHGHSGYVGVDNWSGAKYNSNSDLMNLVKAFNDRGYAVFDVNQVNGGTGQSCDIGCPQLMESYLKAFEYIKDNYNVEHRLFIYSDSFGTFPAFNFMQDYPALIKTAVCTGVRASIKSVFDRGESYAKQIAEKFGFDDISGDVYEADKLVGYDVYANIITLNDTDYIFKRFPPFKALISTGDTNNYEEAVRALTALRNGGNAIHWRTIEGLTHHEICYCTVGGLLEEVCMWFDRYK